MSFALVALHISMVIAADAPPEVARALAPITPDAPAAYAYQQHIPPNAMLFSIPSGRFIISGGHWFRQSGPSDAVGQTDGPIFVPANVTGKRSASTSRSSRTSRSSSGSVRGRPQSGPVPVVVGSETPPPP